ncbi:MAG: hypothetical protein ACRENE_07530, partial [Polyangiaceae bacterium]
PFIERALKKDRNERFPSAIDMARALSASAPSHGQQPLSRLPDVASLLAPSVPAPATFASPRPPTPSPANVSPVLPEAAPRTRGVGDTLSSAVGREELGIPPLDGPTPAPALADGDGDGRTRGTTLQSEDLPILERTSRASGRKGIAPVLVAVLVAVALAVGFVLGRMTGAH